MDGFALVEGVVEPIALVASVVVLLPLLRVSRRTGAFSWDYVWGSWLGVLIVFSTVNTALWGHRDLRPALTGTSLVLSAGLVVVSWVVRRHGRAGK